MTAWSTSLFGSRRRGWVGAVPIGSDGGPPPESPRMFGVRSQLDTAPGGAADISSHAMTEAGAGRRLGPGSPRIRSGSTIGGCAKSWNFGLGKSLQASIGRSSVRIAPSGASGEYDTFFASLAGGRVARERLQR